jgi:hypothetical protein
MPCLYIEELHDMKLIDVRGQCLRCCLGIEKHQRRSDLLSFAATATNGSSVTSNVAGSILIRWEARSTLAAGWLASDDFGV